MISPEDIHACVRSGLLARERALRDEQAVHGLDALDEAGLQPLLASDLASQGFGVFREVAYPAVIAHARGLAGRDRCDLVLTPAPDIGVRAWAPAPVSRRAASEQLGLFASVAARERDASARATKAAHACERTIDPREACWLEVKVVAQSCVVGEGHAGPNRAYASQLVSALAGDLRKLAVLGELAQWPAQDAAPLTPMAAMVLVLFTLDEGVAKHDLPLALHKALDRGACFRTPIRGGFGIADRVGNGWCEVVVVPSVPTVNAV